MPKLSANATCAIALAAALATPQASAQDRSTDNAVTQAEDAFGFSVGRETIGIYNAGNARGFSPTTAGNVRIDGLYFDPAYQLTSVVSDSTSIKVGLSAQGYPFAAPSGIVDQSLRRPDARRGEFDRAQRRQLRQRRARDRRFAAARSHPLARLWR